MDALRVGIIGLGVGEQHIEGYARHPQCEVSVLCDLDERALARVRGRCPHARVTTSANDVVRDPDIDIVSVASYDDVHAEQVIGALEADKHVFVEKPLCLKEDEAVHIRSILKDKPRLMLSSNLILRKCPRFAWLRQRIRSGEMGEIYYAEGDYDYGRLHKVTEGWRGDIDKYSVVLGGGVHMIDLLIWLTGQRVVSVCASGNRLCSAGTKFRQHDFVLGILTFEHGMLGKMAVNFGCVRPHFHAVSVYGTCATFVNGAEEGRWFTSRRADVEPERVSLDYPGYQKGDLIYSFVESVLGRRDADVTAEDVFRAMSVCFAIDRSRASGQRQTVEYI